MQVGDLVKKKRRATNRNEWVGIILKKEKSTRAEKCTPDLRYECLVRWLSKDNNPYHLPENDEMWWGAWSLEIISASR